MTMIREVPAYETHEFFKRRTRYAFVVFTLNEGERLRSQLVRMKERSDLADIVIADSRSTDGSTDPEFLTQCQVRSLLITDQPGLGTATRMALAYVMDQGYEGVVMVDGNGKDGVEALPQFIQSLDDGYDLVQGSRFIKGGFHKNTPLERYLAIHLIMRPIIASGCGWFNTDPTNDFRAMSMRFLTDPRVQPLRNKFVWYNGLFYLIYIAAKLGFRLKQIPVSRVYPDDRTIPTKIVCWRTKLRVLSEAIVVTLGKYNTQ